MSYNDDLYHWGIKGMKWGIRRFQNKNGTLTALGKKRKKSESKADDAEAKKTSGSKSVKDMSDQELREQTARLNLERQYLDAKNNVDRLNPKQVSKGEQFVAAFKQHVAPELTNVGKRLLSQYMEKKGKELLGLSDGDSLDALKKEVLKLNLQKQKRQLTADLEGGTTAKKNDKSSDTGSSSKKSDKSSDAASNSKKNNPESSSSARGSKSTATTQTPAPVPKKFTPSNSNAQSVHDVYSRYYNKSSYTVSNLYKSGYMMTPVNKLETGSNARNTVALLSNVGDWKMRSLEDIDN